MWRASCILQRHGDLSQLLLDISLSFNEFLQRSYTCIHKLTPRDPIINCPSSYLASQTAGHWVGIYLTNVGRDEIAVVALFSGWHILVAKCTVTYWQSVYERSLKVLYLPHDEYFSDVSVHWAITSGGSDERSLRCIGWMRRMKGWCTTYGSSKNRLLKFKDLPLCSTVLCSQYKGTLLCAILF